MHIRACTFLFIIHFSPCPIIQWALGELLIAHQSGRQRSVLPWLLSPVAVFILTQRRNRQVRLDLLEMWSRLLYSQAPKRCTLHGLDQRLLRSINRQASSVYRCSSGWETPTVGQGGGLQGGVRFSSLPLGAPGQVFSLFIFKTGRSNTASKVVVRIKWRNVCIQDLANYWACPNKKKKKKSPWDLFFYFLPFLPTLLPLPFPCPPLPIPLFRHWSKNRTFERAKSSSRMSSCTSFPYVA